MYVASHIMKTNRAMGVLLKQVAGDIRTDELLHKTGSAFLNHRELSAQEVVYKNTVPANIRNKKQVCYTYVDTIMPRKSSQALMC